MFEHVAVAVLCALTLLLIYANHGRAARNTWQFLLVSGFFFFTFLDIVRLSLDASPHLMAGCNAHADAFAAAGLGFFVVALYFMSLLLMRASGQSSEPMFTSAHSSKARAQSELEMLKQVTQKRLS